MKNNNEINRILNLIEKGLDNKAIEYAEKNGCIIGSEGMFFSGASCYMTDKFAHKREDYKEDLLLKAEIEQIGLKVTYTGHGIVYDVENKEIEHGIIGNHNNMVVIKLPNDFKVSKISHKIAYLGDKSTPIRYSTIKELRSEAKDHHIFIGNNIETGENLTIKRGAIIRGNATIGNNVTIGENAFIDKGAVIEDGTIIPKDGEVSVNYTVI